MKKVLFVSDFDLDAAPGGAQISNAAIIKKGRELGYEIVEHFYNSSITDFLTDYDLLITSNLNTISHTEKINFILKNQNRIRLEHDSCSYLTDEGKRLLFGGNKQNFFLSDFHLEFFEQRHGDIFGRTEIVYDPIDTSIFNKSNLEKIYDIVYVGLLHDDKGYKNLEEFARNNKNRNFDIFGMKDKSCDISGLKPLTNVKLHHEWVNKQEVAKIFQQSKAVFHSPIVNEPFCRMIAESILCGVEEIIGSPKKIGSYLEFQKVGYNEFSNSCRDAADIFWEKVNL